MGYRENISPDERRRLDAFRQDKYWSEWLATLHPNTRGTYESHLFNLLGHLKVMPTELIQRASGDNGTTKDLSKQVKIVFAELAKTYSSSARNNALAALRNLLALNEIVLPLTGLKIPVQRHVKPLMTWIEAERVIDRCHIEYQPVFRFLLWAGMDRERFSQLNGDAKRIEAVKQLLKDPTRDWIKIDVPKGRKSAPGFYSLVPRGIAEILPVLDQTGRPIVSKNNINNAWRNGMQRAGFNDSQYVRFGAHNLRSVWLSEAQRRKLDPVLMQHQLGHIVDSMNYQRIQQDTAWAIGEFRKAWATQQAATTHDLRDRDVRIGELESKLSRIEGAFAVQETLVDSIGGLDKLVRLASKKAPYFKLGEDGRLEPTDSLRESVRRRRLRSQRKRA